MRGNAPPHLSQPGVAERAKLIIPIGQFEGATGMWTQRITATSQTFDALVPLNDGSSSMNMNVYVVWSTGSSTTTDDVTFRIRYAALSPETDLTTATVAVLDTAIAADTASGTANTLKRTAAGVINAGNYLEADALKLRLDVTAVTGLTLAGTVVNVHWVEVEYVRAFI